MIEPTAPINITLQAQEWNVVLGILHDTPNLPVAFRIVAPLIAKMTEQAQAQAMAAPPPITKPNGADDHAPN